MAKLAPVTPGELLVEEFLKPLGITQYRLAKEINVPAQRIGEIVAGKRAITADTATRLGKAIGTSAEFWLGLQTGYDLEVDRRVGVGGDVERVAARASARRARRRAKPRHRKGFRRAGSARRFGFLRSHGRKSTPADPRAP